MQLDPDTMPSLITPPGPRDILICGVPRSGTALLTAALHQPPDAVAVMEPWDALRLPPDELFRSLREEIARGRLGRGRLNLPELEAEGRVTWCRDGEIPVEITAADDHLLFVKLPAFWRYLDRLPNTRFLVCLRDPAEVVASFEATGGRLGEGLDYDVAFNRTMNDSLTTATRDPELRRILLYDYINGAMLEHLDRPNVMVVRYERWFRERDALWSELSAFVGHPLGAIVPRLRPSSSPEPTAERRALLRRHCRTAEPLGYAL